MNKFTSSLLISVASASVLGLATGIQPVEASSKIQTVQSKLLSNELQDFNFTKGPDFYSGTFRSLQANHLVNGNITNKTTELSIYYNLTFPGQNFVLRDSSGHPVYTLPQSLQGTIKINTPFKVGETYSLGTSMSASNFLSFKVVSGDTIEAPTINKITSQDNYVTGTGVAGATIHLTIGGDNYNGVVDNQGNYKISLNKNYAANTAITLYQEKNGVKSNTINAIVVAPDKLAKPVLNRVTVNDQKVTGSGVPGATVYLLIGNDHYQGTVDSNGQFTVLTNKYYPLGTSITVYQEKDGVKSDDVTGSVAAPEYLEMPKLNTVSDTDTVVTGTGTPGATIYLNINGAHFHAKISDKGEFIVNIEKNYSVNTPIEAYQEYNGVQSDTTTTYVQASTKLVVKEIKTNSTSITGTAVPNATIHVVIGDRDFEGKADSDGNFVVDLQGATYKAGTDVTVTAKSASGVETKHVQIYPKDPVINTVYEGDNSIRGTADAGATVVIKVGATEYRTIADSDGDFRQSVDPNLVVSGAKVTVYSISGGLDSAKSEVTVK